MPLDRSLRWLWFTNKAFTERWPSESPRRARKDEATPGDAEEMVS
jgi:hypothetical protein